MSRPLWGTEDILRTEQLTPAHPTGTDELLERELKRMQAQPLTAPLWSISLFLPSATAEDSNAGPAYLSLSVAHELTDGRGLQLLLGFLMSPSPPPKEPLHAASFADTHNFHPPPSAAPVLGPLSSARRIWPDTEVKTRPIDCPWRLSLTSVPLEISKSLKDLAKAHGVSTLHPVLQAAAIIGLWGWVRTRTAISPLVMRSESPLSERSAKLGHAACTGCFVNIIIHDLEPAEDGDFWEIARAISHDVKDPQKRLEGLWGIGTFEGIPRNTQKTDGADGPRSGWEEFFESKADSPNPLSGSLGMSNLGFMSLPAGASDMIWGQASGTAGKVMYMSVIGHEGGLRIATNLREGAVLSFDELHEVERRMVAVMERLAAGQSTIRDLVQA